MGSSSQFLLAFQPEAVSLAMSMGWRLMPNIPNGGVAAQTMKKRSYRSGNFSQFGNLRCMMAKKTVFSDVALQLGSDRLQRIKRSELVA